MPARLGYAGDRQGREALPCVGSATRQVVSPLTVADKARPVCPPRVTGGLQAQRSAVPPAEVNGQYRRALMDMLRQASIFAGQLGGVETLAVLDAVVDPVLCSAEEVTLRKVVRTWAELCEWAQSPQCCLPYTWRSLP